MSGKSKRARACDITAKTKAMVWERDKGQCVVCGCAQAAPNAHYIPRSQGGLGVEENIVTLCTNFAPNQCHYQYDFGGSRERKRIGGLIKQHLKSHYPHWNEEDLIYRKYKA